MNDDDFEQRLQRQPLEKIPPAWRTQILSAAHDAATSPRSLPVTFGMLLWRELIWPCRRIWVGLAPVWVALLVFNTTHSERGQNVTAKSTMPAGEMRLVLQDQQRILAEIIGLQWQTSPVEPPRRPNNQPRSERRSVAAA
jgi:hypothetical protein